MSCPRTRELPKSEGARERGALLPILYVLGLALTITCVIHAARTGRIMPWIYVIMFLPGAGPIAYLIAEMIPDLLGSRGGHKVRQGLLKVADPTRGLRHAKRTASVVDSVDAKADLAAELVRHGDYAQAIESYEAALTGLHRDDPKLLSGLAQARLAAGDGAGAQAALDALKAANPEFASADAHLTYALALEAQGKDDEAREEYAALIVYYPGEEARYRYAQLLVRQGAITPAREVLQEILKRAETSPGHYRRVQREWIAAARTEMKGLGATTT